MSNKLFGDGIHDIAVAGGKNPSDFIKMLGKRAMVVCFNEVKL